MIYLKLAARRGDWRDLQKLGVEPTETMKRMFIPMRAKHLDKRRARDIRDQFEDAAPREWFEVEPGRFVCSTSMERAKELVLDVFSPAPSWAPCEIHYPVIDVSHTCPHHGCKDCKMCQPAVTASVEGERRDHA